MVITPIVALFLSNTCHFSPIAIPRMISLANEVISKPSHQQTQDNLAQSMKEVLDSIHATQAALTADGTTVPGNQPLSPTVVTTKDLHSQHTVCSRLLLHLVIGYIYSDWGCNGRS